MEEFCGSAIVTYVIYRLLKKVLKAAPIFTYQGRRDQIVQEQYNHLAFSRIKRDKLLVGEIDTLTLERQRDRQLIVQLRETIV